MFSMFSMFSLDPNDREMMRRAIASIAPPPQTPDQDLLNAKMLLWQELEERLQDGIASMSDIDAAILTLLRRDESILSQLLSVGLPQDEREGGSEIDA